MPSEAASPPRDVSTVPCTACRKRRVKVFLSQFSHETQFIQVLPSNNAHSAISDCPDAVGAKSRRSHALVTINYEAFWIRALLSVKSMASSSPAKRLK